MKWFGLSASVFALAVMSWLYYDWLTINGMNIFAAVCFVGALTIFATALFEIGVAFRINAGHLERRVPLFKKDQQDLVTKLVKKRRSFATWCFIGCAILELINALGVFGAQMTIIQEANRSNKTVASTVVVDNSKSLQSRIAEIDASIKAKKDQMTADERTLRAQLRVLYDDDKTRLSSPEWQGWTVQRDRVKAKIESEEASKKPLQDALDSLTLQGVASTQAENKATGVINGTLFQFIADLFHADAGVVQFIVMSIPSLLLGLIGYAGLAIFLYYKPLDREAKND